MGRRANGEGSIRQRNDGRWEGRYTAGYDLLSGKRIMKSVYGNTKKECSTKLITALSQNFGAYYRYGNGFENQPLQDWCRFWFETYSKPYLRPNTALGYYYMIEKHIIPFIGKIKLSRLTSVQIQFMYNELKEKGRLHKNGTRTYQPLSDSSVRHIHMILNNCLNQAMKERLIPFNPCINCRVPKQRKRELSVLTEEEISTYLYAAKQLGVYPLFFLEFTSGLRRGELLALLWRDLDVDKRTIKINKQLYRAQGKLIVTEPKTPNAFRSIILPQQTVDLLIQEHNRHPESPLMFCDPKTNGYWSPDAIYRIHKKILMTTGLDDSLRFHDLRHTFATLALQNGVDVRTLASMLGHYNAEFTLDTYTHVTLDMQRGAAEKIAAYASNDFQKHIQINENLEQQSDA